MSSFGFSRSAVLFSIPFMLFTWVPELPGTTQPSQANPSKLGIGGVVIQEDGSSPPFGAEIELNCGEGFKKATEASLSGSFYFEIDVNHKVTEFLWDAEKNFAKATRFPDYENSRRSSPISSQHQDASPQKKHCELRAHLPGYQSRTVKLFLDESLHVVDVGAIVLYAKSRIRGFAVSLTSLKAPRAGKKAMKEAQKAIKKHNSALAEKELKKAVTIYPDFAEAWFWLGLLYQQEQRNRDSRASYEHAVSIDGLFVRPHIGLAELDGREEKWNEMIRHSERALELDPVNFPEAYFLSALAYYSLNKLEQAEKIARKEQIIDRRQRIPKIHLLMANILYKKNDHAGSVKELKAYLELAPDAPDAENLQKLLRNYEKRIKNLK